MIKNIVLDRCTVIVTTEKQILEFDILNPDDYSEYQDPEFIQEYYKDATGENISLSRAELLIKESALTAQLYFSHDDVYSEYYSAIYDFLRSENIDCSENWFRCVSIGPISSRPILSLVG